MSNEYKAFKEEQLAQDLKGCSFVIMVLAVIAVLIVAIQGAVFAFKD